MDIKIKDGVLQISVHDLFDGMSDEEKESLAVEFAWHMPAWKELVQSLRSSFATPNYNPNLYYVRKLFFMLPYKDEEKDDDFWKSQKNKQITNIMRDTMIEIIKENSELAAEIYKMNQARSELYDKMKVLFNQNIAYSVNSILVEGQYSEPKTHELVNKITNCISIEEFVDLWSKKTQEFFEEKFKDIKKEKNE